MRRYRRIWAVHSYEGKDDGDILIWLREPSERDEDPRFGWVNANIIVTSGAWRDLLGDLPPRSPVVFDVPEVAVRSLRAIERRESEGFDLETALATVQVVLDHEQGRCRGACN